jgi:ribonuclease E
MSNKMLIDATHPEETRVVVLRGNRVEEFDFESASRKQLRGNIYLAKVTRVEPSLQAAFVDYGGNRHGFLAFSEIHPDYYQIPVADRQALIEEESRAAREADDEGERRGRGRHRQRGVERPGEALRSAPVQEETAPEGSDVAVGEVLESSDETQVAASAETESLASAGESTETGVTNGPQEASGEPITGDAPQEGLEPPLAASETAPLPDSEVAHHAAEIGTGEEVHPALPETTAESGDNGDNGQPEEEVIESVGGADAMEEVPRRMPRYRRQYKIQEVIKRRQVMLVQVVKEERGTKGAALTTYLSLAGRYSVLMPNTARGGGISRKITNPEDRKRLKEIAEELQLPEGMGVILRTAGASRTKTEIRRDFEYLLRLWETVRDLTLKSTAPTLVYEEGSLIKRAIRDLYHKDIEEIVVEGQAAYEEARDFMRMLMPSHVKNVKPYRDVQPIFARYGIEAQLDAMFSPVVQLKSGGYIVINQAEALVAIDVNSGRATREHSIEETALKTNLEAAAEIARQLRLRDLAGLIVIDFIDMDENRNNRAVERKLKESLKSDRARIQVGRISHFGLLEMSRQRIRTGVLESSTETCPHCGGTGHVRSVSSVALQLLRGLEEILLKGATHNLICRTRAEVALYVLNQKRAHLRALEERFHVAISVNADPTVTGQPSFLIDRGEQVMTLEQAKAIAAVQPDSVLPAPEEEEFVAEAEAEAEPTAAEEAGEAQPVEREGGRRRRRRGRRGRGREERPTSFTHETVAEHKIEHEEDFEELPEGETEAAPAEPSEGEVREPLRGDGEHRRRRRGRRGGRRNRRGREGGEPMQPAHDEDAEETGAPSAPQPEAAHTQPPQGEIAPPPLAAVAAASAAATEEERPRRRSTVREPAPIVLGETPAAPGVAPSPPPMTEPVVISTSPEPAAPKRGWWRRG